jgi:3-hydroxyisobutyrate dehydrogenase
MSNLAFLGTGLLGSGMVEAMRRRGERVTVWNRTERKARALEPLGVTVAPSPDEAVAGADQIHMTLPDDAVVDQVVNTFLPRMKRGAVIVDHSTTSPTGTRARSERMQRAGVGFLHAPVFMSPQAARDASGLMMISGPRAVYDHVAGDLQKMSSDVWYLGERPDLAAVYKLFGNSMLFVITAGLADVFAMAKSNDVSPADAVGLFSRFKVANVIGYRGEKMAKGDFTATFEMTMARKDLRLMLDAADGQPLIVLPAIAASMDHAIAKGFASQDMGAIAAEVMR